MTEIKRFPAGFMWGSGVAAHQVEGGNTRNDWWLWEQLPGHIRNDETSAVAADWWNRAEGDLALAAELGHNAMRTSLEWSRIEPRPGEWDEEAIARYRRILETKRRLGLEPAVTLFHFTLPQWVAGRGGFETSWGIDRFARFVDKVTREYKDLVKYWLTINEPMVYVAMGWFIGVWPPGKRNALDAIKVARTLARAHARAYHIVHRNVPDAQVGVPMHLATYLPLNPYQRLSQGITALRSWIANDVWLHGTLDGVFRPPLGRYDRVPEAVDTHDFMGFQYYFTFPMAFSLRHANNFFTRQVVTPLPDVPPLMGEFRPDGIYGWATWLKQFGKPIIVTENGILEKNENLRPAFILESLSHLHRAIQDGADVRGYFFWTLVDNFEWAEGYDARFGLVHVDFKTQQRSIKPSGYLYRDIARANAITPEIIQAVDQNLTRALYPAE